MIVTALSFLTAPGVTTEAECLQAASDHVASLSDPTVIFDWSVGPGDGVWDLDETVTVYGDGILHRPGAVLVSGVDVGLVLETASAHYDRPLVVAGAGSTVYNHRTAGTLVQLGDVGRTTFAGFRVSTATRDCIAMGPGGKVIGTDLGSIVALDCGSAAIEGHVSTVEMAFVGRVDTGGETSVVQRSTLSVPDLSPDLRLGDVVYVDDRAHYVYAAGGGELELYPHLWSSSGTGAVVSSHGAGLRISGGDTTGFRARIQCQRVGVCVVDGGLYGGALSVIVEASGVGYQLGGAPDAGHRRGVVTLHGEVPEERRAGLAVTRADAHGLVIEGLLRSPIGSPRWEALGPHPGGAPGAYSGWDGATFLWDGQVVDGASVVHSP